MEDSESSNYQNKLCQPALHLLEAGNRYPASACGQCARKQGNFIYR